MALSPATALETAIGRVMLGSFRFQARHGHPGRPGEVIEMLNPEQREALTRLTSDDPALQSLYGVGCPDDGNWVRREMEKFDREVLKIDVRTLRTKY